MKSDMKLSEPMMFAPPSREQIFNELLKFNAHQPATLLFRVEELFHLANSEQFPRSGVILDLGCGDGHIAKLLSSWIPGERRWLGLDVDEEELRLAEQEKFYERLFTPEAAEQNLTPGSVDFVFSNSVLEHVSDIEAVVRSAAKYLKPGGKFIFTVPSEFFEELVPEPGAFIRKLFKVHSKREYLDKLNRRIAHYRYLSVREWDELLSPLGLKRLHQSYYMGSKLMKRWMTVADYTSGLITELGAKSGERPIEMQRKLGVRGGKAPRFISTVGTGVE